jgi:hypothetical protein
VAKSGSFKARSSLFQITHDGKTINLKLNQYRILLDDKNRLGGSGTQDLSNAHKKLGWMTTYHY